MRTFFVLNCYKYPRDNGFAHVRFKTYFSSLFVFVVQCVWGLLSATSPFLLLPSSPWMVTLGKVTLFFPSYSHQMVAQLHTLIALLSLLNRYKGRLLFQLTEEPNWNQWKPPLTLDQAPAVCPLLRVTLMHLCRSDGRRYFYSKASRSWGNCYLCKAPSLPQGQGV